MSWHQHSAAHFAVLTADNAFSIFSIRQLSTPEQLFKISPLSPTATFSLVDLALEDSSSGAREMVAFTFGSTCGWDPLMVYCMTRCFVKINSIHVRHQHTEIPISGRKLNIQERQFTEPNSIPTEHHVAVLQHHCTDVIIIFHTCHAVFPHNSLHTSSDNCMPQPNTFSSTTFNSVVCRSGEVYSLGPIAPFGCLLRTSAVLALKRDSQDDPATLEWLQAATGRTEVGLPLPQLLEKDMWRVSSTVVVQPHSLPGRVLALKVPPPPPPPLPLCSHDCSPVRTLMQCTCTCCMKQQPRVVVVVVALHSLQT